MEKRELLIIVASIVGSSMVMLGESVVSLALPHISATFSMSVSSLQWVVDGYNLTVSAFILLGGSLGDMLGLRRVYVWSTAAFILLSLLCAAAWSGGALIISRTLLGFAGALLTPVSLAILNAQLPERLRGRAIGYWTAWTSIALAAGPLIGGYFVDVFSWRAIFLANIPLGLIGLILVLVSLKPQAPVQRMRIDYSGVALGFLGLAGLTYGLIEGPSQGWSAATLWSVIAGVALFVGFVLWELRVAQPLVDLSLFKRPVFSAVNVSTFLLYGGFAGFGFVFNIFLQTVGGYSAFQTGAAFLPSSIILALLSGRVGEYASRRGAKWFMTIGQLGCAAGILLLLNIYPGVPYITGILPGVLFFSFGLALTVAPLTTISLKSAPDEKSGIASAINNGMATVGPLIIIALLGLVGQNHLYQFAMVLSAALAVLAAALSFIFVPGFQEKRAA